MYKIMIMAVGLWLLAGAAQAAGYLKIDGIDGESSNGQIAFSKFSQEVTAPTASGSTRRVSRPQAGNLVVQKLVDMTSPHLQRALVTGQGLPRVTLTTVSGSKTYEIKLINARIVSVQQEDWREEVQFNYQKITWSVSKGNDQRVYTWNVAGNE